MSKSLKTEDGDELVKLLERGELPAYFAYLATLEKEQTTSRFYDELLNDVLKLTEGTIKNRYPEWAVIFDLECERTAVKSFITRKMNEEDSKKEMAKLRWLVKCRDLKDHHIDFFFYFSGRSREKEIDDIIYEQHGSKKRLRKFYTKEPGSVYLPGLVRFFLRMYNLPAAANLIWESRVNKPQAAKRQVAFSEKTLMHLAFLLFLITIVGVLCVKFLARAIGANWVGALIASLRTFWPSLSCSNPDFIPTYLMGVSICAAVLCVLLFTRFKLVFRLLLPRMLSGIFVGYLVLIFARDVWLMSSRISKPAHIVTIMLIAIVVSLFFLFNEIRNTVRHRWQVLIRGVTVLSLGLLEALTAGIVICDLFGKSMNVDFPNALPGILGEVYPKYVLITAPLSLLIGIFVQLIWDEKPISEPF